jgi:hypothetical protein
MIFNMLSIKRDEVTILIQAVLTFYITSDKLIPMNTSRISISFISSIFSSLIQ